MKWLKNTLDAVAIAYRFFFVPPEPRHKKLSEEEIESLRLVKKSKRLGL